MSWPVREKFVVWKVTLLPSIAFLLGLHHIIEKKDNNFLSMTSQQTCPTCYKQAALLLAAVLLSCPMNAAGDEIFKYVAADGTVTYSAFKPRTGAYEKLEPSCLLSYIGCELARSDWSRVPLNHTAYRQLITDVATRHGVDPALVRAMIHAESNFNEQAVSRAGAQGLMQLMPETQKIFGVKNPYNVGQNVEAGTRLLKQLMVKYRNDVKIAAAAYNAGIDAVERYRGVPPYEETQNYVRRVTQLYSRYRHPG